MSKPGKNMVMNVKQMYMKPKEGYDWNPLRKLPPNSPCPCSSGVKFKKCCRDKLPMIIKKETADLYRKTMGEQKQFKFVLQTDVEKQIQQAAKEIEAERGAAENDRTSANQREH